MKGRFLLSFCLIFISTRKRQKKQMKKISERVQTQKETHREVEELISDKNKTFSLKSITSRNQLETLDGGVVYSESEGEGEVPTLPIDPLSRSHEESDEEAVQSNEEEGGGALEWESSLDEASSDEEKDGTYNATPTIVL